MKSASYHFLSFLLPLSLSAQTPQDEGIPVDPNCCGNEPEGTVLEIRNPVSPELLKNRRQASASNGYSRAGMAILEERVAIQTKQASFLASSEFLVGASNGFTIIPKGGMVTPSRSVKILSEAPANGTLQSWTEFQRRNPSTVRLLPISDKALSGDKKAVEAITEKIKALQTGGIAYVTAFNGSPVSLPHLSSSN